MTAFQKVIQYLAMAFAVFLAVSILGGIVGAVGLFGGLFDADSVADTLTVYSVASQVHTLKVDIRVADFTIETADRFSVESNLKNLKIEEKDGVLTVTEKKTYAANYSNAVLKLYLPSDCVLDEADLVTGAGKLTVETLSAERLHLELGAGAVKIDELNASREAEIDGGAGKVEIRSGTLTDLDMDMGVGQLDLTAAVLGSSSLELGVGETRLTLLGAKEEYRISLDKGIGSATVDGEEMRDGEVYGSGVNRIDIDGGVGAIKVKFKES